MWIEIGGSRVFAGTGGKEFDPAKPCVVLVHGAGMDHSVWALQDRALAHGGRAVLSLDLPGHGRSEGAPQDSVAALADWLAAILDRLGVGQAAIVGHSMGALIALAFAARHPDRARAIALLGAAAAMPVHEDLLTAARENLPGAIAMMTNWGFSAGAALGGNAAPGLWMVGGAVSLISRSRPGVLHTDLAACNGYADGEAHAAQVRCPALVVVGQRDRMAPPAASVALADALRARVETLAGAGHMVMAERPDAVLDVLSGL